MTTTEEMWRTDVGALIALFHDSLNALVPIMKKSRIEWRDQAAYDDWDEISQVLFRNIVANSVLHSVGKTHALELPKYGVLQDTYQGKAFIEVEFPELCRGDESVQASLCFLEFVAAADSFDQIRYVQLNGDLECLGEVGLAQYSEQTTFWLSCPAPGQSLSRSRISELLVEV